MGHLIFLPQSCTHSPSPFFNVSNRCGTEVSDTVNIDCGERGFSLGVWIRSLKVVSFERIAMLIKTSSEWCKLISWVLQLLYKFVRCGLAGKTFSVYFTRIQNSKQTSWKLKHVGEWHVYLFLNLLNGIYGRVLNTYLRNISNF